MPYKISRETLDERMAKHDYLREVGALAMQHTMVSIYTHSTVVRSPDAVMRGRWTADENELHGERLLLNYRPHYANIGFQLGVGRFVQPDAVTAASHADLKEDLTDSVELPRPKNLRSRYSAVVTSRRSIRDLSGDPVSLGDLSTLLFHTQGVTGELPVSHPRGDVTGIKLRAAPSGGGLYPVTLYIAAINVAGLAPGLYAYLANSHRLKPIEALERKRLEELCYSVDTDVSQAGFCVIYGYELDVNSRKYGDAGLVYALIEVGATSQNLHLARTAMGMAGTDQGGYAKQRLEEALGLDGVTAHVVHFSIIGHEGS